MSFELYINNVYKKALLLSAASYFESIITSIIRNYAIAMSNNDEELVSFIQNKAINRQYHTYFNWDGKNTNQFLGLFGDDFKIRAREQIRVQNLEDAETAFIEIGHERNLLVHQNYAEVQLNDTFEEIYKKYDLACKFVDLLTNLLSV